MEHTLEDIKFMFGDQLKNRRKELGLTQEEIAKRMGVLQPHIARAEAFGPRTVDMLLQWCFALEMKLTLEPLQNTALVEKALDDPEAIEELMDASPEDVVNIAPIRPFITAKNADMEFCKHGAVKGLCKKGCK